MSKNAIFIVIIAVLSIALIITVLSKNSYETQVAETPQVAPIKTVETPAVEPAKTPAETPQIPNRRELPLRRSFDGWFAELKKAHDAGDEQKISELINTMEKQRELLEQRREKMMELRRERSRNRNTAPTGPK